MKGLQELMAWWERHWGLRCGVWVCLGGISLSFPFWFGPALNASEGWRTYSGVVVDRATGEPVGGAEIHGRYYSRGLFCPHWDGWFATYEHYVTAYTDAQGQFTIELYGYAHWLSVQAPSKRRCRSGEMILWDRPPGDAMNLVIQMDCGLDRRAGSLNPTSGK